MKFENHTGSRRTLYTIVVGVLVLTATGCWFSRVQPVKVEGRAMAPALNDGDLIIIDRNPAKLARGAGRC